MTEEEFLDKLRHASPDVQALNLGHVIRAKPGPVPVVSAPYHPDSTPADLRASLQLGIMPSSDEAKLNKTEKAYLAWVRGQQPWWLGIQAITLKIGHDCRLTTDFQKLDKDGLTFIDTKGTRAGKIHYEDDAIVKMRVAARVYPFIRFVLAWRDGDIWNHRELPT